MRWRTLALSLLAFGCSESPDAPKSIPIPDWHDTPMRIEAPTLKGRCVDSEGKPVGGAEILLQTSLLHPTWPLDAPAWIEEELPPQSATSSANGDFQFDDLEPGTYRLAIRASSLALYEQNHVTLGAGEIRNLGSISLNMGNVVRGQLTSDSGTPMADVGIYYQAPESTLAWAHAWTGSPLGRTKADGTFEVRQLPAGTFRLVFDAREAPARTVEGHVAGELDLGEIRLEPSGSIAGRALPNPLGDLNGLWVHALPTEAVPYVTREQDHPREASRWLRGYRVAPIRAAGEFQFNGLVADTVYTLRVLNREDPLRVLDAWSDPIMVRSDDRDDVVLTVHPSVRMDFRVEDATTGTLVTEFAHRWIGARSRSEKGVDDLRATTHSRRTTLEVDARGYLLHRTEPLAFVAAKPLQAPRVRLQPGPTLRVTVVNPQGQPIAAEVRAVLARAARSGKAERIDEVVTSADGELVLNDVPEEARVLSLSARGFAPKLIDLRGVQNELRVELDSGGVLAVRVIDDLGVPRAGVRVRCTPRDELERALEPTGASVRRTDAQGLVRFEHVNPGNHQVTLENTSTRASQDPWRASSPLDTLPGFPIANSVEPEPLHSEEHGLVSVRKGETATLQLVAPAVRRLEGALLLDGRPLVGATLSAYAALDDEAFFSSRDNALAHVRTHSHGRFALENLQAARVTLLIRHPELALPVLRHVELAERNVDVEFNLETRTVRGTVLSADGRGVQAALVFAIDSEKLDANLAPALGTGNRNLIAWKPTREALGLAVTDLDGEFELTGVESDVAGQLGAWAGGIGRGVTSFDNETTELSILLSSNSQLHVEGFDPKRGTRALGVAWRWGVDFLHPLTFQLGGEKDLTFSDLSADEWTIFQADLDGWGEVKSVRVLTPSLLKPVGDSRVRLRR